MRANNRTRPAGSSSAPSAPPLTGAALTSIKLAGKACEIAEALSWKPTSGLAQLMTEKLAAGDWDGGLWLLPRPLRLNYLLEIAHYLSDAEYWQMLAQVWTDTEGPSHNRPVWLHLFTCNRGDRSHLMGAQEHDVVAALPERVVLYRGAPPKRRRGMSWTTDLEQARWFAKRFCNGGCVFTTTVLKKKILAYFIERNESEAVIDPRRIQIDCVAGISPERV